MNDSLRRQAAQAIIKGDVTAVRGVLAAGFDINDKLDRADGYGGMLHLAVRHQKIEIVKFLVHAGADINARDSVDWTPVDDAISMSSKEAARFLAGIGGKRVYKTHSDLVALIGEAPEPKAPVNPPPPDEIIFTRPLADRYLTEVFNFKTQEYFSMVRKDPTGPVESHHQVMFPEVKNRTRLREAFALYKEKGGTEDKMILRVIRGVPRVKQPLFPPK